MLIERKIKIMEITSGGSPHFLIITGEASGDLHGSNLVSALNALLPQVRFSGMGGSRMRQAGVETLFGIKVVTALEFLEIIDAL